MTKMKDHPLVTVGYSATYKRLHLTQLEMKPKA